MDYYGNNDWRNYLAHHGRLNQVWGVRNGPPYPLGSSQLSAAEKKVDSQTDYSVTGADKMRKRRSGVSERDKEVYEKRREKTWNNYQQDLKKLNRKITPTSLKKKDHETSDMDDLLDVNPSGSMKNCMFCSVGFEMRRRGYDVEANDVKRGLRPEFIKEVFPKAKMQGWNATNEKQLNQWRRLAAKGKHDEIEKVVIGDLKKQGVGARGYISVRLTPMSGHAMSYEVKKNGVEFYDAQRGATYDPEEASDLLRYTIGASYARLDNVDFDQTKISMAVKNKK